MKTRIKFLDLAQPYESIRGELLPLVDQSFASGSYILNEEVEHFEREWASFCGAKYAVGVGNGLEAIEIMLLASGINAGDEIAVPTNTFIGTWLAISRIGAKPIPIEPDPVTFNISPTALREGITQNMRAVLVVHLYGLPADLSAISQVAKSHGLLVFEDAAQAHGASTGGKRIGGHGNSAAWSFYPGKNLGAFGDAGAITTNDLRVAKKARQLRNYGSLKKYSHEVKGVNSRLDPVQALVLSVKLKKLEQWNARRSSVASHYREKLLPFLGRPLDKARHPSLLSLPETPEGALSSWHLFVIRVTSRERFQKDLLERFGIETLIHYPIPVHRQPAFREYQHTPLGVSDVISKQCLSLPIGPHLTETETAFVADSVVTLLASR